jgi:transcriptional adapter 2-alpha
MPFRHEFEREFENEAEQVVQDIRFREADDPEAFGRKVQYLVAYNGIVAQRSFRDRIIEDWRLQDMAPHADLTHACFQSPNREDREIETQLLGLIPFMEKAKVTRLARSLHRQKELSDGIARLRADQKFGIRSSAERRLCHDLTQLMVDDALTADGVEKWNAALDRYVEEVKRSQASATELITGKEGKFCKTKGIEIDFYLGAKEILIREFIVRGRLSVDDAIRIDKAHADQIALVYQYLSENGWVA